MNMSRGLGELLTYINTATSSWISNSILIAIFMISMITYYKAKMDFAGGMAVSGFVTFIIGLLFWLGGFISGVTLGIIIAIAVIGLLMLLLDND